MFYELTINSYLNLFTGSYCSISTDIDFYNIVALITDTQWIDHQRCIRWYEGKLVLIFQVWYYCLVYRAKQVFWITLRPLKQPNYLDFTSCSVEIVVNSKLERLPLNTMDSMRWYCQLQGRTNTCIKMKTKQINKPKTQMGTLEETNEKFSQRKNSQR